MREFSVQSILLGIVIGVVLGAANAFVGLQVGMTISASIPAAVMSLLILRTFLKRGTLLESNMVQTVGSAGESIATGMIFTLPALFMLGEEPAYLEMVIWSGIGGLLGVCFMVPLRMVLIVREHGKLPYPEGIACAEVLESGERSSGGAKSVIVGTIVGGVYYLISSLGFWMSTAVVSLKKVRTEFQLDSSPALLGVGFILGARLAAYMLAGAILSWFILIPAISMFGSSSTSPIETQNDLLISNMSPQDIWSNYIRYIGAGAVAVGGLISLFKSFPTIVSSFLHVLSGMFSRSKGIKKSTEKDFPFPLLILIVAGLAYAMWQIDAVKIGPVGSVIVIVFAFLFVTVSSRLVGLVGSSSNPISGMTIATLLATSLIYKFFVMGDVADMTPEGLTAMKVTCLSVGAIACVAISVAGDTSQDLKTGFLLKATPYKQQVGEMIGIITSVIAIAGVILLLNKSHGFVQSPEHPHPFPAPQANIMKILVEGVLGGQVPWTLIMMGGAAAVIVEMLRIPSLPFAVGMYLPLGLSTPIMVGGLVRWLIDRKRKQTAEHDPGMLTASGLVAGMGLMGVTLAGISVLIAWWWNDPRWLNPVSGVEEPISYVHFIPWLWSSLGWLPMKWGLSDAWWKALPMIPFAGLVIWLWLCAWRVPKISTAVVKDNIPPPDTDPKGDLDHDPEWAKTLEQLTKPRSRADHSAQRDVEMLSDAESTSSADRPSDSDVPDDSVNANELAWPVTPTETDPATDDVVTDEHSTTTDEMIENQTPAISEDSIDEASDESPVESQVESIDESTDSSGDATEKQVDESQGLPDLPAGQIEDDVYPPLDDLQSPFTRPTPPPTDGDDPDNDPKLT